MKLISPAVTAAVTSVGAVAGAVAGIPYTFPQPDPLVQMFGVHNSHIISFAAAIVSGVSTIFAGAGRSFIKSVDNPKPKQLASMWNGATTEANPLPKPVALASSQTDAGAAQIRSAKDKITLKLADILFEAFESAPVQEAFAAAVAKGEAAVPSLAEAAVGMAKAKGGVTAQIATMAEAPLVAFVTSKLQAVPPAEVVAFANNLAKAELKAFGG